MTMEMETVDIALTENEVNLLRLAATGGDWEYAAITPIQHRNKLFGFPKETARSLSYSGVYTLYFSCTKLPIMKYNNIFWVKDQAITKTSYLPEGHMVVHKAELILKEM